MIRNTLRMIEIDKQNIKRAEQIRQKPNQKNKTTNEDPKMYSIITGEIKDFDNDTFNYKSEWYILSKDNYYPIHDRGQFIGHRFNNEVCLPGRTIPE